eukprot:CAMPEP_0174855374 /NCGR_PEP_ID=MMETSP1114-20130205/33127_1 /TAXON_ID=312471 /ORGANISM="Neobodo designis, Strain CCAP 1951/1" /LENGTH=513 /DNA_ID=CAMNT_0016090113 /DNA_START=43 /DNA_END=1584 /DNA_ORIENTATION=+
MALLDNEVSLGGLVAGAAAFFVVRAVLRAKLRVWASGPKLYRLSREDSPVPEKIGRFWYFLMGDAANFYMSGLEAGATHKHYGVLARKKCGSTAAIAAFTFGPKTELLVTNPIDVRHALLDAPEDFSKDESITFLHPLLGKKGLIALIDEREHTKQLRNVSHAFSPLNIKCIAATTMREHLMSFVAEIRQNEKEIPDVPAAVRKVTLAVIADAAFGVDRDSPQLDRLNEEFRFFPSPLMLVGPKLFNALPLARHRRDRSLRAHIMGILQSALTRRAHDPQKDEHEKHARLIDFMAENKSMHSSDMLDHVCTFAFAGHDTTTAALTWLVFAIASDKRVQSKLAEELSDLFGLNAPPPVDALMNDAPYLRACIDEGLRYHNVVSGIQRVPLRDVVLPGSDTFVRAGTMLQIPITFLHRDETVWGPDAETYRPERWIEDPGLRARVTPCSYMPFSVGKRACLGKDFAMHELVLTLAVIVRNFELAWPEGQAKPFRQQCAVVQAKEAFKVDMVLRAA